MHYSWSMPLGAVRWAPPFDAVTLAIPRAEQDVRWPSLLRKLNALRKRGRRSIRIVDAHCGSGALLIAAVRHARALGFLAIEGRGVDSDPALIARARAGGSAAADPAIGLVFEVGEAKVALREEAEFPADIVVPAAHAPRSVR